MERQWPTFSPAQRQRRRGQGELIVTPAAAAPPQPAPRRANGGNGDNKRLTDAMMEAEQAISKVMNGERNAVELAPRESYVRRLQHQLAERYNVNSESRGREPNRRVKIYRS